MTLDEARALAASTGCTAEVYFTSGSFNAYYSPYGHYIVLLSPERLPRAWAEHILLHESGHCMQFQDGIAGTIQASGPNELEWDADRRAIRWQAARGVDGEAINHDIWAWVYRETGYKGYEHTPHGTLVGRITRGLLNRVFTRIEAL